MGPRNRDVAMQFTRNPIPGMMRGIRRGGLYFNVCKQPFQMDKTGGRSPRADDDIRRPEDGTDALASLRKRRHLLRTVQGLPQQRLYSSDGHGGRRSEWVWRVRS